MTGAATPLDRAHAAMTAAPDDEAPRRAYLALLAGHELLIALRDDGAKGAVEPESVEIEGTTFVIAHDGDARLTAGRQGAVARLAATGAEIARLLAPEGLGLILNPGAPEVAFVLDPEGVRWLDLSPYEAEEPLVVRVDWTPGGERLLLLSLIRRSPLWGAAAFMDAVYRCRL